MKILMESWRSYLNEEEEQLDEGMKETFLAALAALGIMASPAQAQKTYKTLSKPMVQAVQQVADMKPGKEFVAPKGIDADTIKALLRLKDKDNLDKVETLIALDKRTRLEDPFAGKSDKPEIVTVDFDDTLKMEDSGTANPIVISQIKKETKPVHIVTSRKDTPENRKEIEDFVKENELNIKGIHFTNLDRKSKKLNDLNSIKHYDNDPREWKNIENNAPEIEVVRIDFETGKVTTN